MNFINGNEKKISTGTNVLVQNIKFCSEKLFLVRSKTFWTSTFNGSIILSTLPKQFGQVQNNFGFVEEQGMRVLELEKAQVFEYSVWFGELPNGVEEWIGRPMPNFEQVFHEALVRHSVSARNGLKYSLIFNLTGCLFSVCCTYPFITAFY